MELYQEILVHLLKTQQIEVNIPAPQPGALEHIVESICYQTLLRIQEIVQDDCFDDAECFQRIEEIVCTFEAIGSDGGSRHDFG